MTFILSKLGHECFCTTRNVVVEVQKISGWIIDLDRRTLPCDFHNFPMDKSIQPKWHEIRALASCFMAIHTIDSCATLFSVFDGFPPCHMHVKLLMRDVASCYTTASEDIL